MAINKLENAGAQVHTQAKGISSKSPPAYMVPRPH